MKISALNLRRCPVLPGMLAFLLAGSILAGCDKKETDPETELPLETVLSDNGFLSADGEKVGARSFTAGDQAGVFLLRDGQAVAENIPLTYDGQSWTSEKTVKVNGEEICFVY
ncbi:MAG TPA: hypothetical protein DDX33_01730, partial [Rikenellaceae bacterium]|nr:hypothetical protein [Rikenellaceae bacterium]